MTSTRLLVPVLLISSSLVAVSAGAQTLTADEKELASYTLTMPTVKKVMSAMMLMAQEEAKDPKVQEKKKLEAQIDALQAKDELTEAQQAELDKLIERRDSDSNTVTVRPPVSVESDSANGVDSRQRVER